MVQMKEFCEFCPSHPSEKALRIVRRLFPKGPVKRRHSHFCKSLGNIEHFLFIKEKVVRKRDTVLVWTLWESGLIRYHLLQFQEIFTFRSPAGVQIQSGFVAFFDVSYEPKNLFPGL